LHLTSQGHQEQSVISRLAGRPKRWLSVCQPCQTGAARDTSTSDVGAIGTTQSTDGDSDRGVQADTWRCAGGVQAAVTARDGAGSKERGSHVDADRSALLLVGFPTRVRHVSMVSM
jgi:hypothetical protein